MQTQTKFSITDCAKLTGFSRTTLYKKYINVGKLSVIRDDNKVFVELSELVRVFPEIKITNDGGLTPLRPDERLEFAQGNTQETTNLTRENDLLREQLRQAQERESWFKSQIDELQQQQWKLLEDKTTKKRRKIFGVF
jgi:hypothetical protein